MPLRLISRRFPLRHRGRCPALILTTCEGCCRDDVSSISCNESTPHTSSISPTEICHLVAMVLTGVSLIVRASNPYYFTARLFSISFRLSEEVRTEDPRRRIILANEPTRGAPQSWVHAESRKVKITETGLHGTRTSRFGGSSCLAKRKPATGYNNGQKEPSPSRRPP